MEISHEEFIIILNEKDKYEKKEADIWIIKSNNELNKEVKKLNNRIISENSRNA